MSSDKVYSMAELSSHNNRESAWLAIDGDVYDVTKFIKFHPGGAELLLGYAGTDATEAFFDMHRTSVLVKYKRFIIGRLDSAKPDRTRAVDLHKPGTLSMVPYAEPSYLQGWQSPNLQEKHVVFRKAVRKWYDENVVPIAANEAKTGKRPSDKFFQKMGQDGMLAIALAPSPLLTETCIKHNIPCPGGGDWKDYDCMMEQFSHEEHSRVGVPGYTDGMKAGFSIAAPCIVQFGTQKMKEEVLPEVLLGNKKICLAISEPFAGSDVANIKCTATKTPCGKFYIVNGAKKWITSGMDSDYFVTAVRTGKPGMGGISLILIERGEGVSTKLIKTAYAASAGTAYVILENVKVPVENLVGRENKGFKCIMNNFNHERWMICVGSVSASRAALSDSILWAKQRKVFGKPLIAQPVIQGKLSDMAANVEAAQAMLDNVTYQMQHMSYKEQGTKLAGPIALLKYYVTRVQYLCADHASQIFGGRALTSSGMGQNVERFARACKYNAIYGGSEEIMQSLAAKQMMKRMPLQARL